MDQSGLSTVIVKAWLPEDALPGKERRRAVHMQNYLCQIFRLIQFNITRPSQTKANPIDPNPCDHASGA